MPYLGELVALGTALGWTITALSLESAARRVGSLPVNLIRLVLATGFLIFSVGSPAGVSSVPVIIIVPTVLLYRSPASSRSILGSVVAVGGVAVLFM
ncbi:MAG: hypothetical protein KAY24_14180 [Candidatus Eisenbacteria sp.]|nr:hypothetical protein [Candidatus Eisenbacteria bacterium]